MAQSRMMYGILTWGLDYYRIEKLQKRFVRIISSSEYNVHSEPLFKVLDILKIEHLFSQSCLKFVYKFKKCQLPKYFLSLLGLQMIMTMTQEMQAISTVFIPAPNWHLNVYDHNFHYY